MLDKNFSFDCHINKLVKKLLRAVGKAKPILDTRALLHLYYAIFHFHIQCCITSRSSTYETYLNKL